MSREEEGGGDMADLPDFLCDNDEIDRMIEERAGAFNLTGTNIRNILYHVVLGVGGARDFWDATEQEFHTPLQMPEPKTRAAKQKILEQESGAQPSNAPLLTLPEVRSPDHEEEDEDEDYVPHHDTEGSDYSDDEHESLAPTTPKSSIMTPSNRKTKASECESEPATPTVGLAKRTRSLFSLKDRDLLELESALPQDEEHGEFENDETKGTKVKTISESSGPDRDKKKSAESDGHWDGLEKELEDEFDNLTDEDSSDGEESDAADEGTFGRFLKGIVNPREEFPEEETVQDMPYLYREKLRFEAEEFRTDKDVRVTKKEMYEMMRDLELEHPDVNEQLNSRSRNCKAAAEPPTIVVEGPLFTASSVDILKEQLQMHLQLLVQHALLTDGTESLKKNGEIARARIEELEELYSRSSTDGLLQAMNRDNISSISTTTSPFKCLDIYPALRLLAGEKPEQDMTPLQAIPEKVAKQVSYVKHIEPLPRDKYQTFNYQPFFHRYLHIRPTVGFICLTKIKPNANRCFTELEDNLLAHGLEAFKFVKEQKVVYELIRDYLLPTKTAKQISIRIKNKTSNSATYNVIKHWKDTGYIRYDTNYTTTRLMKSLAVSMVPETVQLAPSLKRDNLDWLVALRDHRRKIQREYNKRRQKLHCSRDAVVVAAKLATSDEQHGFEVAFLLKAKEVLKNDHTTYFNVFKLLAECNQMEEFDCEVVIRKMLAVLKGYPDLSFEFLSIFSPLPELPVEQLLETLSHVKTRILMRNLEKHFRTNPNQYKKIIKMILGANLDNPTATRDALLGMLRGKPDLSDQVAEFFDRCAIKPKANDFEYIDLTDKANTTATNSEGFEEISLLERTSVSTQKHKKLIESINKTVNDQRKQEQEEKIEKKRKEDETKRLLKLEKRKMPARNVVECGDQVLTWTRDQDREILRACRVTGPRTKTCKSLAKSFPGRTSSQVKDRFFTLMQLMKKAQKAAERKARKSAKCTPVKGKDDTKTRGLPSNLEEEVRKRVRLESQEDQQQPGPSKASSSNSKLSKSTGTSKNAGSSKTVPSNPGPSTD